MVISGASIRLFIALLVMSLSLTLAYSQAGQYQVLYNFGATPYDQPGPSSGTTIDSAGNLYGECGDSWGGFWGMLWELDKSGNFYDLHDFGAGTDGVWPSNDVAIDSAGNLYGTCFYGGVNGHGMLWELDTAGNYHDIHDFGVGTDGWGPDGVNIDSVGNLYGVCNGQIDYHAGGAAGYGMVWELDKSGIYHDLHDFGAPTDGSDRGYPAPGVAIDSAGDVYGTASGDFDNVVWEIDKSGNYQYLHTFGSGTDGTYPNGDITIDSAGNLYGTCPSGGANTTFGMVWEIDTSGNYHDIFDFGPRTSGFDPGWGVTIDSAGNLYGTCDKGGGHSAGVVWELDKSGNYYDLHNFGAGTDGSPPNYGVTIDSAGNLSGTCSVGGSNEVGMVWAILYPELSSLTFSPAPVLPGEPCSGTVTLTLPAPAGGWLVNLSSNDSKVGVPSSVTVPQGKTTASFPVTLPKASLGETAQISAKVADVAISQNLTILALYTTAVSVSPSVISAGNTATGTVTLNAVTPSAFTVNLGSQYPSYVGVPATVTIPANASSATFKITTKAASGQVAYGALIAAWDAAASKQTTITVVTAHVTLLSLTPPTVVGGTGVTGHLYLNVPAPSGGLLVNLSSQYPNLVGVPASVTIPAGSSDVTFAISTKASSGPYTCWIKSTDPVGSQTVTLSVQ